MLKIYKTDSVEKTVKKVKKITTDCWIELTTPTIDEIEKVVAKTKIDKDLILKMLDEEELPRVEQSDNATLIVIDTPFLEENETTHSYKTYPLGIIITKNNYVVTITTKKTNILKVIGPKMLGCTQVFENRYMLDDPKTLKIDRGIQLPEKPVIFVANHGFRDDVLATVLAAKRHAYLYCGSLPLFYNSFNGYATSLVGQVMTNRKSKQSKRKRNK